MYKLWKNSDYRVLKMYKKCVLFSVLSIVVFLYIAWLCINSVSFLLLSIFLYTVIFYFLTLLFIELSMVSTIPTNTTIFIYKERIRRCKL